MNGLFSPEVAVWVGSVAVLLVAGAISARVFLPEHTRQRLTHLYRRPYSLWPRLVRTFLQ